MVYFIMVWLKDFSLAALRIAIEYVATMTLAKAKRHAIIIVAVWALAYLGRAALHYGSAEEIAITVTRAIVKSTPGTIDQKYLVWAVKADLEPEVFEVTDSWLWLTFNSSDRFGRLADGKNYTVKVAGYRFPLMSWYRNIVAVTDGSTTGR